MATIKLNLDNRSLKDGMANIRIRICARQSNAFINTGIRVEPKFFIKGVLYEAINPKAYNYKQKREALAAQIRRFEEGLFQIEQADREAYLQMSANDIRDAIMGRHGNGQSASNKKHTPASSIRRQDGNADFLDAFDKYGQARSMDKTRQSYAYVWRVLYNYVKQCGNNMLLFSDITYEWLVNLEQYLRTTGRGDSTVHMVFSYIRAAYREAERMHIIGRDGDPFFDYQIRAIPDYEIETLTKEELRRFIQADLTGHDGWSKARDVALMSLYLCGANLMDICDMQKPVNGEIVFVRHKISGASLRPVHIRVEPELQILLDRWSGEKRLVRFCEGGQNFSTFQRRVTKQLDDIGQRIGIKVTLAKIRRTWASIAGSLDISDRVIDKSMGHKDQSVKNLHYEDYDWARTARANRAVIDAIYMV